MTASDDERYCESLRQEIERLKGGRDHDALIIAELRRKLDSARRSLGGASSHSIGCKSLHPSLEKRDGVTYASDRYDQPCDCHMDLDVVAWKLREHASRMRVALGKIRHLLVTTDFAHWKKAGREDVMALIDHATGDHPDGMVAELREKLALAEESAKVDGVALAEQHQAIEGLRAKLAEAEAQVADIREERGAWSTAWELLTGSPEYKTHPIDAIVPAVRRAHTWMATATGALKAARVCISIQDGGLGSDAVLRQIDATLDGRQDDATKG